MVPDYEGGNSASDITFEHSDVSSSDVWRAAVVLPALSLSRLFLFSVFCFSVFLFFCFSVFLFFFLSLTYSNAFLFMRIFFASDTQCVINSLPFSLQTYRGGMEDQAARVREKNGPSVAPCLFPIILPLYCSDTLLWVKHKTQVRDR